MTKPSDWQDRKFTNEEILSPGFPDLRGGINQYIADQLDKFFAEKSETSGVEAWIDSVLERLGVS